MLLIVNLKSPGGNAHSICINEAIKNISQQMSKNNNVITNISYGATIQAFSYVQTTIQIFYEGPTTFKNICNIEVKQSVFGNVSSKWDWTN